MKAASRLTAACGALALSCLGPRAPYLSAQAGDTKPIDDPQSYAVYSALLPDQAMQMMRRSMIVIQAEAIVSPNLSQPQEVGPCWPSGPPIETEWKTTLDSLRIENAQVRTIREGFTMSVPYIVRRKADIQAAFSGESTDWTPFYNRYPDSAGYLQLSAVGFDPDRTKAMVYVAHSYGNQGGEYAYYLLRKLNGHWQEVRVPGVRTCQMWS